MSLRKKPSTKKSSRQERSNAATSAVNTTPPGGGGLPDGVRGRLLDLFGQIEREFETLYTENAACEYHYLVNYAHFSLWRP